MSSNDTLPRHSPSIAPSKLPRFLQKQSVRDRSKSVADSQGGSPPSSLVSASPGSSAASPSPELHGQPAKHRKTSKFLSINKDRKSSSTPPIDHDPSNPEFGMDDPPIIVEPHHSQSPPSSPPQPVPIPSPRARTRSERPAASAPEAQHLQSLYSSTSSTSRIGDLPTRLSGWFAHTFSTSSTDLSLPNIIAQHGSSSSSRNNSATDGSTSSPRKLTGPAALIAAAKHGKGTLDKAMRYLLDSDAVPDKCADPIWLLGVQHPGWEPPASIPHSPVTDGMGGSMTDPGVGGRYKKEGKSGRGRAGSWRSSSSSAASSTEAHSVLSSSTNSHTGGHSSGKASAAPGTNWPPAFYLDFSSRIWLTYRSHFGTPIRDARLGDLEFCSIPETAVYGRAAYGGGFVSEHGSETSESKSPVTSKKPWNWGAERTWSSDTGWGCMLRTGQSLLANALIEVHLGREWRHPPHPVATADYATYVRILTWFLDTPAPQAPFSVHRMALAGKELGTDVGQWFGPSVAAGAIKTLVNSFPECGLAVALATDSTLYQSQVFAASHGDTSRSPRRQHTTSWGERPVLLLLGIRLGIEGVNPIYYETIKMLYTFPQSVGIAGGRPSSSYYFVGSQADSLFYLDPHNPRPAIPLRPPPPAVHQQVYQQIQMRMVEEQQAQLQAQQGRNHRSRPHGHGLRDRHRATTGQEEEEEEEEEEESNSAPEHQQIRQRRRASTTNAQGLAYGSRSSGSGFAQAPPASPASVRTAASGSVASHAPTSPSPLQQQFSHSSADSAASSSWAGSIYAESGSAAGSGVGGGYGNSWDREGELEGEGEAEEGRSPPPSYQQHGVHRVAYATPSPQSSTTPPKETLDPVQLHYCNAYSAAELKTFHCDRVRKMPLSGLDPSMLIGFLCRDEKEWRDFKRRVSELPKTIFSIENEPPTWPSDSDDNMGLESISEPDDLDMDEDEYGVQVDPDVDVGEDAEDDIEGEGESEQFFDTRSRSASSASPIEIERDGRVAHHAHTHSTDTSEEDPADPVTPGPTSKFDLRRRARGAEGPPAKGRGFGEDEDAPDFGEVEGEGDDIEDDWVDPSVPTPTDAQRAPQQQQPRVSPPSSLIPTKSSASSTSVASSRHSSATGKTKKAKKQTPVPVPSVRIPQAPEQMHYPFPVTPAEEQPGTSPGDRPRNVSTGRSGPKTQRMHTARARDGGRTQSGGVKGILTDD